jgi:predicted enzyme related to lactoylglutathione lyase
METRPTHARANVRDLQARIDYCSEWLGFKVRSTRPPDEPNYVDFPPSNGGASSMIIADPVPPARRFNFDVEDVDALWRELRAKVEVVEPLFGTAKRSRKFTIRDRDGNELGSVQGLEDLRASSGHHNPRRSDVSETSDLIDSKRCGEQTLDQP